MLSWIWRTSYDAGVKLGERIGAAVYGPPDPDVVTLRAAEGVFDRARAAVARAAAAVAAGRHDEARAMLQEAIALLDGVPVDRTDGSLVSTGLRLVRALVLGDALGGLADLERLAGAPDRELPHLRAAAAAMHDVLPGSAYEGVVHNRIGVALFEAGALDEAIDAHELALEMLDRPVQAPHADLTMPALPAGLRELVLSSLGNAYIAAGNVELGGRLAAQALSELPGAARGGPHEAACLGNAAAAALAVGDPGTAVGHLERAVSMASPDPRHHLAALNNLGHARLLAGDLTGARSALEQAQRLLGSRTVPAPQAASVLNNLAVVELRSGHPDAASALFERAAAAEGVHADRPSSQVAWARANLAVHHLDAGRIDEAVAAASAGVEAAERVRALRGTPTGREQLSERLQTPYQALIAALCASGDPAAHARAFSVAEMSRARGLADTFSAAGTQAQRPSADEVALRGRHARARRDARRAAADPATPVTELQRLATVERKLAWQVDTLARQRARAGTYDPVDVAAVQRELGPRTLLLSYEINDRGLFVWSVRRHDVVMRRLTGDIADVAGYLRAARPRPEAAPVPTTPDRHAAHQALGPLLLGRLPEAHLQDVDAVVVVPGLLGYLPWELLPVSPDRLLGDVVPVSFVPSGAAVVELGRRAREVRRPAKEFLGVAPTHVDQPLPAARREMHRVASRFEGADVREGTRADVAGVLRDVGAFRHVHFACHGYLDDGDPLQSGFVLDPPPGADDPDGEGDLLHLHALVHTGLLADTVVCSGCETGLGRLREGEGMVGFATALLAAGARLLLLNLWPVADGPTARLVAAFYDELAAGADPVRALWLAKIAVRRSHPAVYADPATWAGLVAVGVPSGGG